MAAIRRNNNFSAKLVLLGNSGTGKTSLVLRFVKDQFIEFQIATIGAAFWSQKVVVNEDTTVKFEIWDTAGQERYHSMAPLYCRGAAAAVIVYDITNIESFLRAKTLVQELKGEGEDGPVMALVGNKVDLEANRRVNAEEAHLYAEQNGAFFLETSAKYATNVNEIFSKLAQRLVRAQPPPISNGIVIFEPVDPPILLQATRWWTCFVL